MTDTEEKAWEAWRSQKRAELLDRLRLPPFTPADVARENAEWAKYRAQREEARAKADLSHQRRMARATWAGITVNWAPMRFVRWVRGVVRSLRETRWRLLMRMAGERPRSDS